MISKHSFTVLILLVFYFPLIGFSQSEETQQCIEKDYPFTGIAEQTLCDDYGNITCNLEIGEGTPYTHSSQLGASVTGEICIIGDFIIDQTFQFHNATVKVNTGVSIQMNVSANIPGAGGWLFINNTKFFACEGLWKGIDLNNESAIYTTNDVQFEDAETAIHAKDRSALIIRQTTFNRNVNGIHLERTSTNKGDVPYLVDLQQNDFTCDAPLNGTLDEVSFSGIKMTATYLFSLSLPENRFTDLQYGIYAQGNAHIGANYFNFKRIKRDGIFMEFGSLDVGRTFFTNCEENGINVDFVRHMDINKCYFTTDNLIPELAYPNYRKGILAHSFGLNANVMIDDCYFISNHQETENVVQGIHFKGGNVGSGTAITIKKSDFEISARFSFGIHLDGAFPESSSIYIHENDFLTGNEVNSGNANGIRSEGNKSNLKIFGNYFSRNGYWSHAINAKGSEGFHNSINYNTIGNFNGDISKGFWFRDFENTNMCSNVNNWGSNYAFEFWGANPGTKLFSNQIHANAVGINLFTGAIIGPQIHRGNEWYPVIQTIGNFTFTIRAAQHAICTDCDLFQANLNKFTVHTEQSIWNSANISYDFFSSYHPENIIPDIDDEFFEGDLDGTPEICDPILSGLATIDELDQQIAGGTFIAPANDPTMQWKLEKYLYAKLKRHPELMEQHPNLSSFVSDHESTAIGQFFAVSTKIETAILASEAINEESNLLIDQINSMVKALSETDSLLEVTIAENTYQELTLNKINLMQELDALHQDYTNLSEIYQAQVKTKLQAAYSLNELIGATTSVIKNQKTVHAIYLLSRIQQNGELTEEQIETLAEIASQCPEIAGFAVYQALGLLPDCTRSKLELCEAAVIDNEEPIMSFIPKKENNNEQTSTASKALIYPNPTNAFFNVSTTDQIHQISISDISGKVVFQQVINTTNRQQAIQPKLSEGLYLVNVKFRDGTQLMEKLIIQSK